jgi:predicted ABC-type ATPase
MSPATRTAGLQRLPTQRRSRRFWKRPWRREIEVRIWYVGLTNTELHIARVHAHVKRGGHDIPEERIHQRYARSRLNLIQLMPKLTELRVYDNSVEADPHTGATPEPSLIVHLNRGKLLNVCELASTPEWAKPIVLRALTSRF